MKIIVSHWDFLLATLFLLPLGRDELEATHWSHSCSALSHVPCAPHWTTLFFITCFTPSLIGKQEAFMRPWWVLTVGKPYDKGSVEIQIYRSTKINCLVTQSHSERNKNLALSLYFWIFQVMIVHFSALFLEDEKKVLPGDKTNLLWDKYLKNRNSWTFPVHF